uniref:Uncharacterized protein n=1 Tax=Anguilla anguilla TaxID=7936 RepID=A0A0E9RV63_ANGAN
MVLYIKMYMCNFLCKYSMVNTIFLSREEAACIYIRSP